MPVPEKKTRRASDSNVTDIHILCRCVKVSVAPPPPLQVTGTLVPAPRWTPVMSRAHLNSVEVSYVMAFKLQILVPDQLQGHITSLRPVPNTGVNDNLPFFHHQKLPQTLFTLISNSYLHLSLPPEGSLGSRSLKDGLALDLGCAALAIKGQKVDVKLPLLKQG